MLFKMDNIFSKYKFEPVNEETIQYVKRNPLLTPIGIRYIGMGHYEIIASIDNNKKYILIIAGGSNGYDAEYNCHEMLKLTERNAITYEDLIEQLNISRWNNQLGIRI